MTLDAELAKTIAAYGGLSLGLINLWLVIYKDYLRRAKLTGTIRRAQVRAIEDGTFDVHIDVDLNASGGSVYLKSLSLAHGSPLFDPVRGATARTAFKIINSPGYSALDLPEEEFEARVKALFGSSENVVNLKISDREHRVVSFIDRLLLERDMDGYWDWPRSGWIVQIEHSEGSTSVPFSFEVHRSSKDNFFCGS